MKIVSILVTRDDADVIDAQIAFHLNTGVDFVIATDHESRDGTVEILESYARAGHLRRIAESGESRDSEWRTRMARLAATEYGADWVLSSDSDEFWWPRGESLKDVLAAVPPRYGVVQGLVRIFEPRRGEEEFFAERMTVRPSLLPPGDDAREPLPWALRPVYRADPRVVVDRHDGTEGGRRVPLRAWYPIEVLRFPFRSLEQTEQRCAQGLRPRATIEAEALEAQQREGLAAWFESRTAGDVNLVRDDRLRGALRFLRAPENSDVARQFALPSEVADPLVLKVPDIVDDASYAGECAAVGEVDLEALERQIVELEGRISWLEARFWPRVLRTLSRAVRR